MGRYSSTELIVQNAIPQLQIRSLSRRDLASSPCEPSWRITPKAFIRSPISRTRTIPRGSTRPAAGVAEVGDARRTTTSIHSAAMATECPGGLLRESAELLRAHQSSTAPARSLAVG